MGGFAAAPLLLDDAEELRRAMGQRYAAAPVAALPAAPLIAGPGSGWAAPAMSPAGMAARPTFAPAPLRPAAQPPEISPLLAERPKFAPAPMPGTASAPEIAPPIGAAPASPPAGVFPPAPLPTPPPTAREVFVQEHGQRPAYTQFHPAPMPLWKKILAPIAVAAAGWGNPQGGARAYDEIYNEPRREAQERYQAATGEYDRGLADAIDTEREDRAEREADARIDEARARTAHLAPALEPPIRLRPATIEDPGKPGEPLAVDFNPTNGEYLNPDTHEPIPGAHRWQRPAPQPEKERDVQDWLEARHLENTAANRDKARDAIAGRGRRGTGGEGETPAQRQARIRQINQAETEKTVGLDRAEREIRQRYGLTRLAANDPWPAEAIDELQAEKQRVQDLYETKLANLGVDVQHFDYGNQRGGGNRAPGAGRTANGRGGQAQSGKGITLDRANPADQRLAAQILEEAGGDVEKARKIARQRGYRF
jgi:hypothetical protein